MEPSLHLSADDVREAWGKGEGEERAVGSFFQLRRSIWTGNYRAIDVDLLLAKVILELERRETDEWLLAFDQLTTGLMLPVTGRHRREDAATAAGRRRKE